MFKVNAEKKAISHENVTIFFSYKETSEKLITTIQDPGFIKIGVEISDRNTQNYRTGFPWAC